MGKRFSILLAAGLIATLFPLALASTSSAAPPPFKLTWPKDDSVINNGTFIIATLGKAFPRSKVKKVVFEISKDGAGNWSQVRGTPPPMLAEFITLMNAEKLKPGPYDLRARLFRKGADPRTTKKIDVLVNDQPVAVGHIDHLSLPGRSNRTRSAAAAGVTVHFDTAIANQVGATGTPQWKFHDETTAAGDMVSKTYPGAGTYPVMVSVTDNKGGEMISRHELEITGNDLDGYSATLKKVEKCGCESMTVKTSGTVEGPPDFDFSAMGPGGVPGDTALGPQAGDCRFEVIATLTPGSDPAKCAEGARYQAAVKNKRGVLVDIEGATTGPLSSDAVYDSSRGADDPYSATDDPTKKEEGACRPGSGKWCDGGYHGGATAAGTGQRGQQPTSPAKRYHDGAILMLFEPGIGYSWSERGCQL